MHDNARLSAEAYAATMKGAPPVAVTALSIAGVGLQDWVFILTAVYLVVQTGYLMWRWLRDLREPKPGNDNA